MLLRTGYLERIVASRRPHCTSRQEGVPPLVDVGPQAAHLALQHTACGHRLEQIIDRPLGDAVDVGLLNHRTRAFSAVRPDSRRAAASGADDPIISLSAVARCSARQCRKARRQSPPATSLGEPLTGTFCISNAPWPARCGAVASGLIAERPGLNSWSEAGLRLDERADPT